jgi:ribonuclease P protein component
VDARFPRAARVRKSADFERNRADGSAVHTKHLVIVCSPGSTTAEDGPRLGLVASRKVGGAVERNRGKRLVRELFRRNRSWFPPGDVVIILKVGADELGLAALTAEVERAAGRLRTARRR